MNIHKPIDQIIIRQFVSNFKGRLEVLEYII